MTGIGEAQAENDRMSVAVELRSVNNRHLKLTIRSPDAYLAFEQDIEKVIRRRVARGTVSVAVRVHRHDACSAFTVDSGILAAYWAQLRKLADTMHLPLPSDLSALLSLPGVVVEAEQELLSQQDWPFVQGTLEQALDRFDEFRAAEGASMGRQLAELCDEIERHVAQIAARAPEVVTDANNRLRERISQLIQDADVTVTNADLVREVGILAERSDVHEEITRLSSHLQQFRSLIESEDRTGRTMDFLCQEMNRETNTIGSKANDVTIAREVVATKGAIERIREIVQNVE